MPRSAEIDFRFSIPARRRLQIAREEFLYPDCRWGRAIQLSARRRCCDRERCRSGGRCGVSDQGTASTVSEISAPPVVKPTANAVIAAVVAAVARVVKAIGRNVVCPHQVAIANEIAIGVVALIGAPEGELDALLLAAVGAALRNYILLKLQAACA